MVSFGKTVDFAINYSLMNCHEKYWIEFGKADSCRILFQNAYDLPNSLIFSEGLYVPQDDPKL